jgi:hypothetical protein
MELTHISEFGYQELRSEEFDYFIATCGYQPRCFYLADSIHSNAPGKLLLTIDEPGNLADRNKHMDIFIRNGFRAYKASIMDSGAIRELVGEICNNNCEQMNILIDYSCMPKKWYSVILDNITYNNFKSKKINLFLSYTPKLFEKVKKPANAEYFGPIIDRKDSLKEKRPVVMVAALDNNARLLAKAIQQIRPHKILAFVPDCNSDPEYTLSVIENNKSLLDKLSKNNIIHYDVSNPIAINSLLTSCCLDHRIEYEVMVIPQGPKVFSMMALLLSIRYPDVKLWEIIRKNGRSDSGHGMPAANPVVVKVSFQDDEQDDWEEDRLS